MFSPTFVNGVSWGTAYWQSNRGTMARFPKMRFVIGFLEFSRVRCSSNPSGLANFCASIANSQSVQELTAYCNRHRDSNNLFCAFRVDGHFQHVRTRAMRANVNQMLMQPFANYNLRRGWYLTFSPIVTANWEMNPK